MAHHQHHGVDYDANSTRSLQTRPAASPGTLPAISEDELAAEADEPPEPQQKNFTKTIPRPSIPMRRESLLTKAFTTDPESHGEEFVLKPIICHNPSISSTCSTMSGRSAGDFTSDDGLTSPGTRASTPSSPRSFGTYTKRTETPQNSTPKVATDVRIDSNPLQSPQNKSASNNVEPSVEAQLGRKRCISFMCGRNNSSTTVKPAPVTTEEITKPDPPRKPCLIKFLCPAKVPTPQDTLKDGHPRNSRLHSPAPPSTNTTSPTIVAKRSHRDSDATVKNDSPKATTSATSSYRLRRLSNNPPKTEATRFYEFATSDEETEDWIQESTCHRSRLTVTDTLKKENEIRQLAEEAEEEALEEDVDEDSSNEVLSDLDDEEDEGFNSDDEDGFAESDDSESDSDYEWWAPRRSPAASRFIPSDFFRPSTHRTASDSSLDLSRGEDHSPKSRRESETMIRKNTRPVAIRPTMPELPDSTDFICGTLDEDRPLEQAYMSRIRERKAAKHRAVPQDIDPTFPTSDPEAEKDEDEEYDEEDELNNKDTEIDHPAFLHGHFEADDEQLRGVKYGAARKRSPPHSPRRLRSPPAPTKRGRSPAPCAVMKRGRSPAPAASTKRGRSPALVPVTRGRSPAPRGIFFHGSPMRLRSPPSSHRLTSPPPSRRGSANASPTAINMLSCGQALLGQRNYTLTHTSSLPRSPHPFGRRRRSSAMTAIQDPQGSDPGDDNEQDTEYDDKPYSRGAIDIVQGLEHKRLKRREKLFKQYWKQQEKKKDRRPQPGKGAERMRQVGIECAKYRGKRILSV